MQARLLEHNVRFGDPECQCLMMRLQSDLLEVLLAAADGRLGSMKLQWSPEKALTVSRWGTWLLDRPVHLESDRGLDRRREWRLQRRHSCDSTSACMILSDAVSATDAMRGRTCRWCWLPKDTLAATKRDL